MRVRVSARLRRIEEIVARDRSHDARSLAAQTCKMQRRRFANVYKRCKERRAGLDSSLALKELSDLVGWIPEVAADTDLVEAQWNKLYEASEVARKQLVNAKQISPELASQIEALCTLLVESAKLLTKPSESQSPSVTELIAN